MTDAGIWMNSGQGWELGSPQGFPDEATLHRLIQENPQILPLAGSPSLTVLGGEVQLGTGSADILAVESSGRPTIIEVKLYRNPEARRNIVAQVIAYAAFLQGYDVKGLEQGPLRRHLADADYDSILDMVQAEDQEGAVDADSFVTSLQEFLAEGIFRWVLVLDEVSAELERVIAYLDSVTVQGITIDLIVVKVYEVNGAQVALPQRVSPDLSRTISYAPPGTRRTAAPRSIRSDGPDAFRASIADITGETRAVFDNLVQWAEEIALLPNVRLFTTTGVERATLLPRIIPGNIGFVTIWNDRQRLSIEVLRSRVEKYAPNSIELVERAVAPVKVGQGTQSDTVRDITPQVLEALTAAYQEATDRN